MEEIKMNEQNTNLTEVRETHHLAIEQTAMDLILTRVLQNDVDMNRLEHLIALREKEIERQNHQDFVRDLSSMQTDYQKIQKNSVNSHIKSTYVLHLISILTL